MTIGTDIASIERMRKSAGRESFVKRVFSQAEREMFLQKRDPAPSMAANWAGKEAFAKALGTGVRGFELNEIEILRDTLGAPFVRLCGNARLEAEKRGIKKIHISLSHERDYAVAFVVTE